MLSPSWFFAVLLISLPVSSSALERTLATAEERVVAEEWMLGCTNSISYYNLCAGWIWAWGGWAPEEQVGVAFNTKACGDSHFLYASAHYAVDGSPAGYGYTGTMELRYTSPLDCPQGSVIDTQPFLPSSGWNIVTWGTVVPSGAQSYSLVWTNGTGVNNPVRWGSDQPAAFAGVCFSGNRRSRSARFGTATAPLCPGDAFTDAGGPAELLWAISGTFTEWIHPAVSAAEGTRPTPWARVKAMYR